MRYYNELFFLDTSSFADQVLRLRLTEHFLICVYMCWYIYSTAHKINKLTKLNKSTADHFVIFQWALIHSSMLLYVFMKKKEIHCTVPLIPIISLCIQHYKIYIYTHIYKQTQKKKCVCVTSTTIVGFTPCIGLKGWYWIIEFFSDDKKNTHQVLTCSWSG